MAWNRGAEAKHLFSPRLWKSSPLSCLSDLLSLLQAWVWYYLCFSTVFRSEEAQGLARSLGLQDQRRRGWPGGLSPSSPGSSAGLVGSGRFLRLLPKTSRLTAAPAHAAPLSPGRESAPGKETGTPFTGHRVQRGTEESRGPFKPRWLCLSDPHPACNLPLPTCHPNDRRIFRAVDFLEIKAIAGSLVTEIFKSCSSQRQREPWEGRSPTSLPGLSESCWAVLF